LGPETYDSLGNETYLTSNIIPKGTGKEHLVDSCIFDNGTTTCIKNNLVGTGTITGTTIYGSTAVCSPVGKFTSCIDVGGTATFSSDVAISGSSGALYSLGQLGFTNTGAGGQYGIYTLGTATPTMYFDHRATGNTGQWVWRSGTGGATTAMALSGAGVACFACSVIASGLLTVSGFGTSNFSSGGTGYNKLTIRNTTAGVANGAQLSVGVDTDADQLYIQSFSSTFTTSGMNIAGGAVINGEGPGGLSIAATQSNIGFYTNGSGAANLRMRITCAGLVGIGCNTPGYTLDVNGSGHFTSVGTTMLIESTQPTNSHTLKIVQCADGGNGNTDQGLVVQINGADGTSNIANFYDYNNGTAISRVRFLKNGVTCFQNTVCAPTFAGSTVRGSSNLDLNGNSGYLTLRTGDATRLFVGSTGGVSVGAVSDPGLNNFIVAGTICSAGQVKGSSLFAGGPACGSGWRLGGSTYNVGYESDGLWGTNSTPNFIQSPVGLGIRIGYTDNGSGLYGAAYGFDVSYKDGLNNCIDYNAIIMRNSGQGTTPFRVTSYGNIYGVSKNFRIKHPIPYMNDTHYLIHTSIEGPQADLIYRGKVQLVDGKAEVNIDLASRMTDGTFEVLCQDVQSYTTNESGWSLTKSYVIGNILHIEAQDETVTDIISWLVIGERKDDGIKNSAITDDNGHVIVEELKPEEGL
jgi:hypothetical protein